MNLQLAVYKCNECGQTLPENFEAPADEPWTTGIFGCTEDMDSCKFFICYKTIIKWVISLELIKSSLLPCLSYSLARILLPKCSVRTCLWNSEWGRNLMEESMCLPFDCSRRRSYSRILASLYSRYRSTYHVSFLGRLVFCLVDVWDLHWRLQANSPAQISSPGTNHKVSWHIWRLMLWKRVVFVMIKQNSPCDPCMVHCFLHFCAVCQAHREMKNRLSDNFVMPMTVVNPPPVQEMSSSNDGHHHDSVPVSHHSSDLVMRPL